MKHLKKLLAVLVMAAMLLPMGRAFVSADETNTFNIVVRNDASSGYQYLLYQMLVGDIAEIGGQKILSNVRWGQHVPAATQELMYNMAGLTGENNRTAAKFAEWLGTRDSTVFHQMIAQVGSNDGSSLNPGEPLSYGQYTINGTATNGYGKTGVSGGYYLIRNTAVPSGETFSDYIVFVVKEDTVVNPKTAAAPTPEKKVTDKNDSYPKKAEVNQTGDSADYDIGDEIPYKLSVQLPSNFTSYTNYKLVFIDEMSKGLTLNSGARIHYGASDTVGTSINFEEIVQTGLYEGSKTYKYETADLKGTDFSAYNLTDSSVVWIEYTATLNKDAVIGESGNPNRLIVKYSNNPTGDTYGETEPDETTVFTFKLIFNKVDSKNNPLTGADFVLEKWISTSNGESGTWTDVVSLGAGDNRPTKSTTDSGAVKNCVFTFSGLDDGRYRLRETVTPAGYNTLDNIEFTVTAAHEVNSSHPQLTGLAGANGETSFVMTANKAEGTLSANIINESGAVLPTTGAEGTMFLLFAGTALAFVCIMILVIRRRMRAVE